MKYKMLFALGSALALCALCSASSTADNQLSAEMELFVGAYNSTGASSYVADTTHICAAGSYGSAQVVGDPPPYDLMGRSHMGSNTKSMTAVLLAVLLEKGLVRGQTDGWETTLGAVFPAMAADTPYERVTLRALASMYAGLPANPEDYWVYWYARKGSDIVLQRENITRDGLSSTPVSTPGTEFLYSNWGYVILGHIAEVSLNMTWEDAFLQYIVVPLQLVELVDGKPAYYPFGAPYQTPTENWGHVYINESTPHYPCDPNNPPIAAGFEDFKCDNCPNMGPAGNYLVDASIRCK
jgi:CubicO group peptidase (beta-lactamase class C family)